MLSAVTVVLALALVAAARDACEDAGAVADDEPVPFRVALQWREGAHAALDAALATQRVLSGAEARALVVEPSTEAAAVRWARHTFDEVHVLLGALRVTGRAEAVRRAFGVPLRRYRCGRALVVRATGPLRAVPPFVTLVHDLTHLPVAARRFGARHALGAQPGQTVTPALLRALYQIAPATASAAQAALPAIAVAEFEQAYFYAGDLAKFQALHHVPLNPVTVLGPNHPQSGYLGEASLDVQYVTSVAWKLRTFVVSIKGGFDLLAWADVLANNNTLPKVHSISWGSGESNFDAQHLQHINKSFKLLAAMGYTIFASSGDDGTGHTGTFCGKFDPNFPAVSPYVTAVGGLFKDAGASTPQTLWPSSGAGTSAIFARPQWQQSVYNSWLQTNGANAPAKSYWNQTGRAIPDVSFLATNFQVYISNSTGLLSGTSASSPSVASMFAYINTLRVTQNKAPIGFLNPVLYKLPPSAFLDIVDGQQSYVGFCPDGFKTAKGWDLASGFGAPLFPPFMKALLAV